jgi:hypothetical protein
LNLKALQVLVALTGMSLEYIVYRILQPAPLARNLAWEEMWLPALILLVCTGFAEELIFRGMMQEAVTPDPSSEPYPETVFEAGQYPVPSTHVTQCSPTFGVPVRLPCSKSPSRGRFTSLTVLHGTPPRRGLRALHARIGLHTRLIDLLRFPRDAATWRVSEPVLQLETGGV